MDREMTKITKELIENGYSSVRHPYDGEQPDNWFVFAVWRSFEEKNLDCIRKYNYDEEKRTWFFELDLGEMFEDNIKTFIKSWNERKPYKIRCSCSRSDADMGFTLAFKNAIKY